MVIETYTSHTKQVQSHSSLTLIYIVYNAYVQVFSRNANCTTNRKYIERMHNENPFTSINFQINYNIFHFNWYGTIASIRHFITIHTIYIYISWLYAPNRLHVNFIPIFSLALFFLPREHSNCFRIKQIEW